MAITTSPAYPVAGETVTIAESTAIGDVQVIELTSAPSASTMTLGFLLTDTDQDPSGSVQVAENSWQAGSAIFDEPGEYAVTVYDIRQWVGAPSFPGDPAGELRYQLIGTYTGTIHIAAYVDLPILTGGGIGATLRLTVSNDTVRAAELVSPTTEAARVAGLQAAVLAAAAALVGSTVAAIGTDLQAGLADLLTKYEAHRALVAGVHFRADAINTIDRGNADSQGGAILLLNEMRPIILGHLLDSTAAGVTSRWHNLDQDDLKNIPIARTGSDLGTATVLSADLRRRCYERHRIQATASPPPDNNPASHTNPDAVNSLAAASLLDTMIVAYLDALVEVNPSVVAGEPEGAIDAVHRYGFESVPS